MILLVIIIILAQIKTPQAFFCLFEKIYKGMEREKNERKKKEREPLAHGKRNTIINVI